MNFKKNSNELAAKKASTPKRNRWFRESFLLLLLKIRYFYIFKYWSFRQKSIAFLIIVTAITVAHSSRNELKADSPKFYVVKNGVSLFNISGDYKVNIGDLIIWNSTNNSFTIHPGENLMSGASRDTSMATDSTWDSSAVGSQPAAQRSITAKQLYAKQALFHYLQKGENLYRLSLRYNVSIDSLKKWNKIEDVSHLDTGIRLIVEYAGRKSKGAANIQQASNAAQPILQNPNASNNPTIPGYTTVYHVVQKGDNILRIAIRYSTYMSYIASWNHLEDISKIDTGMKLIVGYVANGTSPLATQEPQSVVQNTPAASKPVQQEPKAIEPAPVAQSTPVTSQEKTSDTSKKVDTGTALAADTTAKQKPDSATLAQNRKDSVAKEKALSRAISNKKSKWLQPNFYLNQVRNQPWIIAALIIITTLFMFGVVALLSMVIILRIRSTVNETISLNFSHAFEDLITGVIYADHDENSRLEEDEFDEAQMTVINNFDKKYLVNPFHRQLCIDHLLNLYKNLTGISSSRVVNLYHEFKLNHDSLDKVKSRKWHIKAKGIQEAEQMHVDEAYKMVYKLIDHPIDTLRYESQIAVMSLKEDKNLLFLEELKLPLTEWQQMMLANKLHIIRNRDFSNMDDLLNCKNVSVVCLAVKIIQDFNMLAYVPRLRELLQHPDPVVKMAVADAMGGLIAKDAMNDLLEELKVAPSLVKERILDAASRIGIDDYIAEVSKYIFHDNFEVAHAAANALVNSGEKGIAALREIVRTNEENLGIQVFNSFN